MTETIRRVQHKRMSASDWANSSLVLLDGELGVESDTGKLRSVTVMTDSQPCNI